MNKVELIKSVNKSGFPFQIAVEHLLKNCKEEHGWEVFGTEVPWKNTENMTDGYVDLIIRKGKMKLIVECKRVLNEPNWTFLCPQLETKGQSVYFFQIGGVNPFGGVGNWLKFFLEPEYTKSEYCIMETKERTLIEGYISTLVDAIEGTALLDLQRIKRGFEKSNWYVPVIITTAKLITVYFEAGGIDLSTGKIPLETSKFEEVGAIRFEKTMKTGHYSKNNIVSENGRVTCMVINVEHLVNVLKNWRIRPDDWYNGSIVT